MPFLSFIPPSLPRYHRVKFSLEGERGRKATVFAEVASGTGEFRYLLVVSRDFAAGGKVISIVDRRPPRMTREERQARVSSLLQDAGWAFVADNEVDAREQARVLGDYWLKVKAVTDAERVAASGVAGAAWLAPSGEPVGKGVKDLAELERMTQRLARDALRAARGSGGVLGFLGWGGATTTSTTSSGG